MANANPFTSQRPLFHALRIKIVFSNEFKSLFTDVSGQTKAKTNVKRVNIIAMVKGAGNKKRIPLIYLSIRDM